MNSDLSNGTFKIESGIPLPTKRSKVFDAYPLKEMEVGDSFLIENYQSKHITLAGRANLILAPKRFSSRRINGKELRIWRIE